MRNFFIWERAVFVTNCHVEGFAVGRVSAGVSESTVASSSSWSNSAFCTVTHVAAFGYSRTCAGFFGAGAGAMCVGVGCSWNALKTCANVLARLSARWTIEKSERCCGERVCVSLNSSSTVWASSGYR